MRGLIISSSTNIAIFGFGRIGRNIFRLAVNNPSINIVAISEQSNIETLHYLLMRDSIYGTFDQDIKIDNNDLVIGKNKVKVLPGNKPGEIPWDTMDIDFVIDATGKYLDRVSLQKHIGAGAKRVIVTRTASDDIDRTLINGINDSEIKLSDKIISATSSTTQSLGLMLKILDDAYTLKRAMVTTIHAYTSDQPLADAIGTDLRRSRSAAVNIIPNTTEAPQTVQKVIPKFKGLIEGIAFNVPVSNGSCIDLSVELENLPDVQSVNSKVKEMITNDYTDIIGYTEDPIVSSDVTGINKTMLFDSKATMITSGSLLKTICWYDNGWGFANRILDTIQLYAKKENN